MERFREIEVEVSPSTSPETLEVILSELRSAGAVPTDPIPKYSRALGTRAWLPPEVVVGDVGPLATAGQLVRHAVAASADRYLRQEPGVRLGEDPEAVHQTRVGFAVTYAGPRLEGGLSLDRTVSGSGGPVPVATQFRIVIRQTIVLF